MQGYKTVFNFITSMIEAVKGNIILRVPFVPHVTLITKNYLSSSGPTILPLTARDFDENVLYTTRSVRVT